MDRDLEYLKAKVEANSGHNDGWTRQFYQEIVDKYEHINDDPHDGCLLYTSPSPRDATLSRMPSSA